MQIWCEIAFGGNNEALKLRRAGRFALSRELEHRLACRAGGRAYYTASPGYYGLFCLVAHYTSSDTYANRGSRLLFIP